MFNFNWNTNINVETGIRYGVISMNSVSQESLDIGGSGWEDLTYQACKREALREAKQEYEDEDDFDEDNFMEEFNDSYQGDGDTDWAYSDNEYQMESCLDNDLMILKSPYYTYARLCSPCVPNAGDLNSDADEETGYKTYCLGREFFDEYSPLPYKVYSVETGEEITE